MVENDRIYEYAKHFIGTYYVTFGFRKSCYYCSYNWENREPVIYTNWYGSEPNSGNYDCAVMGLSSTYAGLGLSHRD
mgnify:CR=1 FL=1